MCIPVQDQILETTVLNKIAIDFPPDNSFKKMFLRTLMDIVINQGEEFSEKLLNEYMKTLSVSNIGRKKMSYKSYLINKDCVISLQESPCFVTNNTTGLQTWEASKYLAEWCLNNSSVFEKKKILELGCGVGLLGLTIIKQCHPSEYRFTDKSQEVLDTLIANQTNNIPYDDPMLDHIQHNQCTWSTLHENHARIFPSDIILGADLVYDTSMIESLAHALKIFLYNGSTVAYIASTIRDPETDKKFLVYLGSKGLSHKILEPHKKSIFVYNPASSFVLYEIRCYKNL